MEVKTEEQKIHNAYKLDNQKCDLLIICPSRGRPELAKRMLDSFHATSRGATAIVFVLDADDKKLPEYKKLLESKCYVVSPRKTLIEKFNFIVNEIAPDFKFYGEVNDDHVYKTKEWDITLVDVIEEKGKGWGIAFGNDLIHHGRLPGAIVMSGNIIRLLGYMALPTLKHQFVDNFFGTLADSINRLFYVPEVVIEHMHMIVGKAEKDKNYEYAYDKERQKNDQIAFQNWLNNSAAEDVTKIVKAMVRDISVTKSIPRISLCMIVGDFEDPQLLMRGLKPLAPWISEINLYINYKHFPRYWRYEKISEAVQNQFKYNSEISINIDYGKWKDDFSQARNISLDMATGDYIYWQDVDDIPVNPQVMCDFIARNPDVPFFRCKIMSMTHRGTSEIIWHNRLFKNLPEYTFRNSCHEDITFSMLETDSKCITTNITLQHTGNKTWKDVQRKNKRNYALIMKDLNSPDAHSLTYYNVINCCMLFGGEKYIKKAIEYIDIALEKFDYREGDPIVPKFWIIRGMCCLDLKQKDAAKQSFLKAWEINEHPESAIYLGSIYIDEKNFDKGIEVMEKVLKKNKIDLLNIPFDFAHVEKLLLLYTGDCWANKKDLAKAEQYYGHYLNLNPNDLEVNDRMAQVYFQTNRIDAGARLTIKMVNLYPSYHVGWSRLGQYEMMCNRYLTAEMFLKRAVKLNPRNQEAWVNLKSVENILRRKPA